MPNRSGYGSAVVDSKNHRACASEGLLIEVELVLHELDTLRRGLVRNTSLCVLGLERNEIRADGVIGAITLALGRNQQSQRMAEAA